MRSLSVVFASSVTATFACSHVGMMVSLHMPRANHQHAEHNWVGYLVLSRLSWYAFDWSILLHVSLIPFRGVSPGEFDFCRKSVTLMKKLGYWLGYPQSVIHNDDRACDLECFPSPVPRSCLDEELKWKKI
ncbi:hypothetical protein BU23DRAFT_336380 [Bimuria novae-zelandiae CBS 107.79]|uniref:Uncharacterized protein n=1 Tax=Bimuria novae-zelandiae CBS 107.79 TaxID=1447943 RepID=A0A6A5ULX4_9PLEO|nr:hypothetical protein BU23DRAFT_336380 [Bimuria novae-zelandiae CBS 107.79]